MDWMKTYHEDHKSVMILLAKFTGNVMDLKAGMSTPNTIVEFKEFADIINNVIIPHFKSEETTIYAEIKKKSPAGSDFIDDMLQEHEELYSLFDAYITAVEAQDTTIIIDISTRLEHVLRHHIIKEEDHLPSFLK